MTGGGFSVQLHGISAEGLKIAVCQVGVCGGGGFRKRKGHTVPYWLNEKAGAEPILYTTCDMMLVAIDCTFAPHGSWIMTRHNFSLWEYIFTDCIVCE